MQRPADHFMIDSVDRLADSDRVGGVLLCVFGIAVIEEGKDRGSQRQPRMFWRVRLPLEQPAGPPEPPARYGFFSAKRRAVPGQPHRQARG